MAVSWDESPSRACRSPPAWLGCPIVKKALTGAGVSELEVFAFCAVTGFVVAGTVSSFYQWVTSEQADFSISRGGATGIVIAVLLSMFGGPFIVVQKVYAGLRANELHAVPALFGVAVAGIWSVCAGILFISLLLTA